ncbi:putative transcription factor bHLH family [Helianthus anomalus]
MEGTTNIPLTKARKLQGGQSPSSKPNSGTTDQGVEDSKDEHTEKKLAHREIERQRRRDMADLYASLRGLLPLDFVKVSELLRSLRSSCLGLLSHLITN